jgi:hypothetical protein
LRLAFASIVLLFDAVPVRHFCAASLLRFVKKEIFSREGVLPTKSGSRLLSAIKGRFLRECRAGI